MHDRLECLPKKINTYQVQDLSSLSNTWWYRNIRTDAERKVTGSPPTHACMGGSEHGTVGGRAELPLPDMIPSRILWLVKLRGKYHDYVFSSGEPCYCSLAFCRRRWVVELYRSPLHKLLASKYISMVYFPHGNTWASFCLHPHYPNPHKHTHSHTHTHLKVAAGTALAFSRQCLEGFLQSCHHSGQVGLATSYVGIIADSIILRHLCRVSESKFCIFPGVHT